MLKPKLVTTLQGYTRASFLQDLVAGIIVGIVAIPLAIAFGIASGVTPDRGLVTAIIAGFLISVLGGSRVQIGGPTGAFVVIVYGIVQKHGLDGLLIATIMAGILLVIMGFAKFGAAIKFIPHSVVVGFTSGIAAVIFSSQIKDFLGLEIGAIPVEFVEKWKVVFQNISSVNMHALFLSMLTLFIIVVWPRFSRKIPGMLVAILVTSAVAAYFQFPVETIGSRFGDLPHTLPMPSLPVMSLTLERIEILMQPAFTIALLGAVESLLSAVVSDGMIGGRHRSNMELVAQGVANIGSGLFGGIPATGAIARTVTNIKNGGRTPVAGIVHAITILVIMLFFGHWIGLIPLACLAGILVVVAYNMSEWRSFKDLLTGSRGGIIVLLTTFLVTVLIDLTVAIEMGLVLSSFIFLNRMANITNVNVIAQEIEEEEKDENGSSIQKLKVPAGVEVYEINGPFFFGVAHKFEEATRAVAKKPKVRILRLKNVPLIDSTGLHALKGFYRKCRENKIKLIITGLHVQPLNEMMKANLYDLIGEENVFNSMKDALDRAKQALADSID